MKDQEKAVVSRIEKKIEIEKRQLLNVNRRHDRIRRLEAQSVFKNMRNVINFYKHEYGKLLIDVYPINKNVELPASIEKVTLVDKEASGKVDKKVLVMIKTVKTNFLLAVLHYTLPKRLFLKLKKEERIIERRKLPISEKLFRNVEMLNGLMSPKVAMA